MTHDPARLSNADLATWLAGFSTLRPQPVVTELLEECAHRLREGAHPHAHKHGHARPEW